MTLENDVLTSVGAFQLVGNRKHRRNYGNMKSLSQSQIVVSLSCAIAYIALWAELVWRWKVERRSMRHINTPPCEAYWLSLSIIFRHRRRLLWQREMEWKGSEKKGQKNAYQGKWKFIRKIFSLTILATNWHLIPIFSPPHNIWLGETLGFTCQCYVCPFSHNHIIASHRFHDNGWNWNWGIFMR